MHPSFGLNTIWSAIKGLNSHVIEVSLNLLLSVYIVMLDPETADKIQFLKHADHKIMHQHIPKTQLEKKYGGEVEDLTTFW